MSGSLSDKERELVVLLYRSILKVCKRFDQYPLCKTTLVNPAFTKPESIMTRGWTCTKFGKDILTSMYGFGGMFHIPKYINVYSSSADKVKTGKELLETNKWVEKVPRKPVTLYDTCKQAFRKKELADEKTRQEAYETGFGVLSELNSHWDKMKKEEKRGDLVLRKINNDIVNIQLSEKEESQKPVIVDEIAAESYTDMIDNERIDEITKKPHIPENLENSSISLLVTSRPLKNHLLVAHPMLANTYFERTVIRMDDNNQETGYILGRLNTNKEEESSNTSVFGDVDELMGEHTTPESETKAKSLLDFVGTLTKEFDLLEKKNSKDVEEERVARWYTHQLTGEILDGKWIVVAAEMDSVLPFSQQTTYDKVWEYVVSRLGGEYDCWKDYFVNKEAKPLKEKTVFPKVKIIVL